MNDAINVTINPKITLSFISSHFTHALYTENTKYISDALILLRHEHALA